MPSLLFEQSGTRHGGTLNGRVLIGRRLTHGVVISDASVSRLHAWIDNREGCYTITDAGSRTGTFVNGEAIVRWDLQHGDQIRVGPVNLVYRDDNELPADVLVLDLAAPGTIESSRAGILFDCTCGAPMWVGLEYAGKKGLCKYCGEPIRVPSPAGVKPKPAKEGNNGHENKKGRPAVPPKLRAKCGVCHSGIDHAEEQTTCPDCHTTFHTDCWQENYGCSTYGCAQVNALKPASVVKEEEKAAAAPLEGSDPSVKTPWEMLLLAGSVIGLLVGAVSFGIPPMAVTVAAGAMLVRGKGVRRGVLAGAIVLSLVGVVAGLALSDFLWLGGVHLTFLK